MKRDYNKIGMGLCVALCMGLSGCASRQALTPAVALREPAATVQPDKANRMEVNCLFQVPHEWLSKRSRLMVTPQLMSDGKVLATYEPVVLDAPIYQKKKQRREVLHGEQDPYAMRATTPVYVREVYELPYRETITVPEEAKEGDRLVAVLSTDGCLSCSAVDTLLMATVQKPALPVVTLSWMNPTFVVKPKVMEGQGEAHLSFAINKSEIDPDRGDNRKELERLSQQLAPVLQDSLAQVSELVITGMASADGSHAYNLTLAHARAEAARDWLVSSLLLTPQVAGKMAVNARPEGWEPVLRLMEEANHPGAADLRRILQQGAAWEEDRQEQQIRRLACWPDICNRFLATDRKVAYSYRYSLRSFTTDSELLAMYRSRPDAFNEEELLRVAQLMTSDEERQAVYEQVVMRYPGSQVAINNLALLALRRGDEAEARRWMERLPAWQAEWAGKECKWEEKR